MAEHSFGYRMKNLEWYTVETYRKPLKKERLRYTGMQIYTSPTASAAFQQQNIRFANFYKWQIIPSMLFALAFTGEKS